MTIQLVDWIQMLNKLPQHNYPAKTPNIVTKIGLHDSDINGAISRWNDAVPITVSTHRPLAPKPFLPKSRTKARAQSFNLYQSDRAAMMRSTPSYAIYPNRSTPNARTFPSYKENRSTMNPSSEDFSNQTLASGIQWAVKVSKRDEGCWCIFSKERTESTINWLDGPKEDVTALSRLWYLDSP